MARWLGLKWRPSSVQLTCRRACGVDVLRAQDFGPPGSASMRTRAIVPPHVEAGYLAAKWRVIVVWAVSWLLAAQVLRCVRAQKPRQISLVLRNFIQSHARPAAADRQGFAAHIVKGCGR